MKKWPLLLTVGVVLYLAFLLARLPAAVIAGWLPDTVTLYGTSGTLWNGKAQAAMVGNIVVHGLSWDFVMTQLLRLRLAVEFDARLQSGFLRGRVGTRTGSVVWVDDVEGTLRLASLNPPIPGVDARLGITLENGTFRDGWPEALSGRIDLRGLTGRLQGEIELGDYAVVFTEAEDDPLAGTVRSSDAPLDVSGDIELFRDRRYTLNLSLRTNSETPKTISQGLPFIGAEPQPDGSYSWTYQGRN
ncbi:MAG: type II secretion system protein N [Gammaproteobacteria bacterium]